MNWSARQLAVFEAIRGGADHLMVDAVAGSGKTTTILEGMRHVQRGKSVVFVAFNKDIARTLKQRAPQGVDVSTLHALGLRAAKVLRPSNVPPDAWIDGDKAKAIARRVVGVERDRTKTEWCGSVVKAVSLCKSCLAQTPEEIDVVIDQFGLVPPETEAERPAFILDVQAVLEECRVGTEVTLDDGTKEHRHLTIDFDDMVWLPLVRNLRVPEYDWVFVDETQDLNASQIALAKRAMRQGGRICAVGDPRQAIYGFRGAAADAFDKVRGAFDAKVLPLSCTYRCAKAIVREAQELVPHLEYPETAEEGLVADASEQEMLAKARAGDFVLSRVNAPLLKLCIAFLKAGQRAAIQGRDVGTKLTAVVRRAKTEDVDAMLAYVDRWAAQEVARLERRGRDASGVQDIRECLFALAEGEGSVDAVLTKIARLFADGDETTRITLSSTHKAKGMERDRVWMLRDTYMRARWTRVAGKLELQPVSQEEQNLAYVAMTRARRELYMVRGGV